MKKWPIVLPFNDTKTLMGKVYIYKTLSSIMKACFGDFDPDTEYTGYIPEESEKISFRKKMREIKKVGVFGFATVKKIKEPSEPIKKEKQIHLWIGNKANFIMAINLVAHELGHMKPPYHKILDREEKKACEYGFVASASLIILSHFLDLYQRRGNAFGRR